MNWRLSLIVCTALCAANVAFAQDAQRQEHPSSDRARAGVGLGVNIHIPFGALNQHRQPRSVSVPANGGWTRCGLFVTPGMHVAIDAQNGRWASGRRAGLAARSDTSDAEGYANSAGRETNAPLARANLGSLIARVGDGEPFFVGSHYLGDPRGTGELQLAINDDFDQRSDNRGALMVTCVASHDTPAYVPPPRTETPPLVEDPKPEPPPVVTMTKPPPAPAPETTVAAPPALTLTPPATIETTTTVEPATPVEPAKPATNWGWIIAAIVAGAAVLAMIIRAAGAGAAAAAAITTRVTDDGVAGQTLTFKPGRKK